METPDPVPGVGSPAVASATRSPPRANEFESTAVDDCHASRRSSFSKKYPQQNYFSSQNIHPLYFYIVKILSTAPSSAFEKIKKKVFARVKGPPGNGSGSCQSRSGPRMRVFFILNTLGASQFLLYNALLISDARKRKWGFVFIVLYHFFLSSFAVFYRVLWSRLNEVELTCCAGVGMTLGGWGVDLENRRHLRIAGPRISGVKRSSNPVEEVVWRILTRVRDSACAWHRDWLLKIRGS